MALTSSTVPGSSPGQIRVIRLSLLAFLGSVSLSMSVSNFFLYLAVLAALPDWWRRGRVESAGVLLPFALLSLWTAAAAFWGPDAWAGLAQNKWPHILIFLVLLGEPAASPGWRVSVYVLAVTNALLLLLAPLVTLWGEHWPVLRRLGSWAVRYSGTFTVSIAYALFLVFVLILTLVWLLERERDPRWRGLGWGTGLFCLAALVLTTSRTGWLALAAALVFLAFRRPRLRGPLFVASLLACLFLVAPGLRDLGPLSAVRGRITETIGGYSSGRDVIWQIGWTLIRESPWIGHGTGGVGARYDGLVQSLPGIPDARRAMHYDELHNQYLQILAEWGLIGLTLFLLLLVALLRPFVELLRHDPDNAAASCALALIVALLVSGLFQCSFFYANIARLFWFLLALCLIEGRAEETALR